VYPGFDVYIGNIGLNDTGASVTTSGAYLIGVYDDNYDNISASADLQAALGDLDLAIGGRTYSEEHYVTDDEGLTSSVNALDLAVYGLASGATGLWIDATTYIYPANATDFAILDTTGNVGIGTTAPASKLSVRGDISLDGDDMWIGISDSTERIIFDSDNDDVEIMGASVGIGTTAPSYTLDVNGDIQADNIRATVDLYIGSITLDALGTSVSDSGASLVGLYSDSYTYISASTDVQIAIGQLDSALLNISGDTTPQGSLDGQTIRYQSGWIADSNLFNDGTNVGIGSTSPDYKLEVNGDMRVYPGFDVYIGNIGLNDTGASVTTSGAYLICLYDDGYDNISASARLQAALGDLDLAIGGRTFA